MVGFPPKSAIFIGFSIINHPFWGTSIFGNTHILQGTDHSREPTEREVRFKSSRKTMRASDEDMLVFRSLGVLGPK